MLENKEELGAMNQTISHLPHPIQIVPIKQDTDTHMDTEHIAVKEEPSDKDQCQQNKSNEGKTCLVIIP